ncbi:UPF0481 protein At3g47200-like [Henckelia pumila]|uniref:UPF0481 protein At3g47200-like n=1 Tax=Henckelia pumila TaxID=405737 RepID=UPI003C6E99E4
MHPGDILRVCKIISQKLASVTAEKSKCFIFKVHNHLRDVNDKAYDPEIIAIGPYHRDKDNIKMMEEHKLRYLRSLVEHQKVNIAVFVSAIGEMEQEARKCYAEPIRLDAAQFTEMLVLDGCFIIELVRKFSMVRSEEHENDPIFRRGWMMNSLMHDLILFENQIPFSVLCKLFYLISIPNNHNQLIQQVLRFFHGIFPGKGCRLSVDKSPNEIKHLLELIHISWRPPSTMSGTDDSAKHRERKWRFINSATELRNANVKFKNSGKDSLFDIKFDNGNLLVPPLLIEDKTESFFRNLIAYEQYFEDRSNYVTDYVKFLDSLINSLADVEILCHHGIIDNWRGDGKMVSNMFNKLDQFVTYSVPEQFMYSEIFESVNAHCERRRNKWMAKLKQHHLNSPWAIMSIVAALVLLLLTATQTVCSVLQVV